MCSPSGRPISSSSEPSGYFFFGLSPSYNGPRRLYLWSQFQVGLRFSQKNFCSHRPRWSLS